MCSVSTYSSIALALLLLNNEEVLCYILVINCIPRIIMYRLMQFSIKKLLGRGGGLEYLGVISNKHPPILKSTSS